MSKIIFLVDSPLPLFTAVNCYDGAVGEPAYDFCVKVDFSHGGKADYLLLYQNKNDKTQYNGEFKEEGIVAVLYLPDKETRSLRQVAGCQQRIVKDTAVYTIVQLLCKILLILLD